MNTLEHITDVQAAVPDSHQSLTRDGLQYVMDTIREHGLDHDGELSASVMRVQQRVASDEVRLALLGEFNSGKTTFINAMLGTQLLSTAPIPTTNVLTRINHGLTFSCRATLGDGTQVDITQANVHAYSTDAVDLARLDVRVPLPLLEGGLVLLDTPGFNVQNDRHEQIVISAVSEANACVFLMDARQPGKKTTIEFLKRLETKVDKFFLVVNRADIYSEDEFQEAREYLMDVLQREARIVDPRLYFVSSAAALGDDGSIWRTRLAELVGDIQGFMRRDRDSLVLAELSRLLVTTYERSSHLVATQVRMAEVELQEKYQRQLPDSGELIHGLQVELVARLPVQFAEFKEMFKREHHNTFGLLEKAVVDSIAGASSKSSIREEIPKHIQQLFVAADEHLREFVRDKSSKIFSEHQSRVRSGVEQLFDGLRFVEQRIFMSAISTWVWTILGCALAGLGAFYLDATTSTCVLAAGGGFLLTFLIVYISYKARGSSSFKPPEFQSLDQLISAASSVTQGEAFRRQAQNDATQARVQQTAQTVGFNTFRVANMAGRVANIPGLGLVGAGIGFGVMAIGAVGSAIWDWVTGPSLRELKEEMLKKSVEATGQFSAHWQQEGLAFVDGVHQLQDAALRDRISITVERYEGLLNKLLERDRGILQIMEARRDSLATTLESLANWKARLAKAATDLQAQMRTGRAIGVRQAT